MITHLLFYRIPQQITIKYRGKKAQYDVDWNSKVWEMKIKATKDVYVGIDMQLLYDRKPLDDDAKWYMTSILGKEDVTMHLCKRSEHFTRRLMLVQIVKRCYV